MHCLTVCVCVVTPAKVTADALHGCQVWEAQLETLSTDHSAQHSRGEGEGGGPPLQSFPLNPKP